MAKAERINCEAFQIRLGVSRWSRNRGLPVTEVDGRHFLDPQIEPGYNTSLGACSPNHLKLELSRANPPAIGEGVVKAFSIAEKALEDLKNIRRYRVHQPLGELAAQAALVSIVNHDYRAPLSQIGRNRHLKFVDFFHTNSPEYRFVENDLFKPFVQVIFLRPGEVLRVSQETGSYFSSITDIPLAYDPHSEEGLVFQREKPAPPTPPAVAGGDREPRKPLPSDRFGEIALAVPQTQ